MDIQAPSPPRRLTLARLPTPLRPLERLSRRLGGPRIWLKCDDLSGIGLSGNKVRKLEFLLADAQDQGADTIITCGGLQSNHCRATALACARLGLRCVLLLRDGDLERHGDDGAARHEGNLFLAALAGAEIRILPRAAYVTDLPAHFREAEHEIKAQGGKPYSIPTGGSNAVGLWGYLQAGLELAADCARAGITPQAVVCATGSGGTQAGLTLAAHYWPEPAGSPRILGVAVCDSAAWFQDKVSTDTAAWADKAGFNAGEREALLGNLQIETVDDYIGPGYAQPYPEVLSLIRELAREEGVLLDPVYTGKAFHGMLEEVAEGQLAGCQDIVFVHTGGVYGLFPYAHELV